MANGDYYDILGVRKGVGEEDIRKAFRKKAMEFHPDRNKSPDAEEKFKEIKVSLAIAKIEMQFLFHTLVKELKLA